MVTSEKVFAAANKVMLALYELSHDNCPPEGEYDETEVRTCLQLAAQHVVSDCFDVNIGRASDELTAQFAEYRAAHEVPPAPRVQSAS